MSRRKSSTKEFVTYDGVRMSFLATINLAKHTWDMAPAEAFDWYVAHLEKHGRFQTVETAEEYREALEDSFINWIHRNAMKQPRQAIPPKDEETEAAILYLQERGYTVTKN